MSATAFVTDPNLTQQFHAKAGGDPTITIGSFGGDTMYHVKFDGIQTINGVITPVGIALLKDKGKKDNLDIKRENYCKNELVLDRLAAANVDEILFKATGCRLPIVRQLGPLEDGQLTFWTQDPIKYVTPSGTPYDFIGLQVSDPTLGRPLTWLTPEQRNNSTLLRNIGEKVGRALAVFHNAAQDVVIPHVPDNRDHGWRYGVEKTLAAANNANLDQDYRDLSRLLHDDLKPLFDNREDRVHLIHGNIAMESWGVIVHDNGNDADITSLENFTYARRSLIATDFRSLVLFPEAQHASIVAYRKTMRELTDKDIEIDEVQALKLAGSIHLSSVTNPKYMRTEVPVAKDEVLDPEEETMRRQIAQETIAGHKIFSQIPDPRYQQYADALKRNAEHYMQKYPGIESSLI